MAYTSYSRNPSGDDLQSDFPINLLKTNITVTAWEGGSSGWQMSIEGFDGEHFATCYQDLDVNQEDTFELAKGNYTAVKINYFTDTSCESFSTEETVESGSPAFSISDVSTSSSTSTPAATSSPYIIDVGSTLMLGGILAFMIAYWIVGLARNKK